MKPLLETPLYVLVSDRTGSAAEAVAHTLQQAKHAVVVGQRTKGMANAGQHFLIDDALYIMVPTIRSRNAVSGTNWEGGGVQPDIVVGPGRAVATAMADALNALAAREGDGREKQRLLFMAQGYAAAAFPERPPAGLVQSCIGDYRDGPRIVRVVREEDGLFFVSGDSTRRMTYVRDRTFAGDGRHDYRIRRQSEGGRATRLDVLWFDDTSDTHLPVGTAVKD